MPRVPPRSSYYTSHAIARLLRVSPSTVLSWIDKGLLVAHRTPGGHRRVEGTALTQFLRENSLPIPVALRGVSRLLLVDDDPLFLRATERMLKQRAPDLTVAVAGSAVDALLQIGTLRPEAVLLDAYMPGMNGVEVCRRLHESPETAHILLLAVTGQPSPELVQEFEAAGAVRVFTKPLAADELLDALGLQPAP